MDYKQFFYALVKERGRIKLSSFSKEAVENGTIEALNGLVSEKTIRLELINGELCYSA